jgi:7,8-dihydroneopterin aldolase/epimerase/oxygenase
MTNPQNFIFEDTSVVFVKGLIKRVDIGALIHERYGPQDVRITVKMTVPTITNHGDALENIVPYHLIVEKIEAITAGGHINLVETLAQKIIGYVFEDPRILAAEVTVEKLEIFAEAESAGITLKAHRI